MLNMTGGTLTKYIASIVNLAESCEGKTPVILPSYILGNSNSQNTMSMTHSKANSKDSSIMNNGQNTFRALENNIGLENDKLFASQQSINLFNHKAHVLTHDNLTIAVVTSKKTDQTYARAFTMYMYLQFYREFTPDLLKEFFGSEKYTRAEMPKHKDTIKVENERQEDHNGSELSSEIDDSMNKSSTTKFGKKKDLIISLFRKYSKIPVDSIVQEYMKMYKAVFVNEKPAATTKYFISEITLVQRKDKK